MSYYRYSEALRELKELKAVTSLLHFGMQEDCECLCESEITAVDSETAPVSVRKWHAHVNMRADPATPHCTRVTGTL